MKRPHQTILRETSRLIWQSVSTGTFNSIARFLIMLDMIAIWLNR